MLHVWQPSHRLCKLAYLMPVPSQDKLGELCQEGHLAQLVWTGWQSIQIVGVSACVIFMLHQKIQTVAKCTFCVSYRLNIWTFCCKSCNIYSAHVHTHVNDLVFYSLLLSFITHEAAHEQIYNGNSDIIIHRKLLCQSQQRYMFIVIMFAITRFTKYHKCKLLLLLLLFCSGFYGKPKVSKWQWLWCICFRTWW